MDKPTVEKYVAHRQKFLLREKNLLKKKEELNAKLGRVRKELKAWDNYIMADLSEKK